MSKTLSVMLDIKTTRLIRVCQAVALEGLLPPASTKTLLALARAARAYCEAYEYASAERVLDKIDEMVREASDEESALKMLAEHTDSLRQQL